MKGFMKKMKKAVAIALAAAMAVTLVPQDSTGPAAHAAESAVKILKMNISEKNSPLDFVYFYKRAYKEYSEDNSYIYGFKDGKVSVTPVTEKNGELEYGEVKKTNYDDINPKAYISYSRGFLYKVRRVINGNFYYGIMNADGSELIPARYKSIRKYKDYFAVSIEKNESYDGDRYALMGIDGKLLTSFDYKEIDMSYEYVYVRKADKWGVVDYKGNKLCDCVFDFKPSVYDNRYAVGSINGNYGVIDLNTRSTYIPFKFQEITTDSIYSESGKRYGFLALNARGMYLYIENEKCIDLGGYSDYIRYYSSDISSCYVDSTYYNENRVFYIKYYSVSQGGSGTLYIDADGNCVYKDETISYSNSIYNYAARKASTVNKKNNGRKSAKTDYSEKNAAVNNPSGKSASAKSALKKYGYESVTYASDIGRRYYKSDGIRRGFEVRFMEEADGTYSVTLTPTYDRPDSKSYSFYNIRKSDMLKTVGARRSYHIYVDESASPARVYLSDADHILKFTDGSNNYSSYSPQFINSENENITDTYGDVYVPVLGRFVPAGSEVYSLIDLRRMSSATSSYSDKYGHIGVTKYDGNAAFGNYIEKNDNGEITSVKKLKVFISGSHVTIGEGGNADSADRFDYNNIQPAKVFNSSLDLLSDNAYVDRISFGNNLYYNYRNNYRHNYGSYYRIGESSYAYTLVNKKASSDCRTGLYSVSDGKLIQDLNQDDNVIYLKDRKGALIVSGGNNPSYFDSEDHRFNSGSDDSEIKDYYAANVPATASEISIDPRFYSDSAGTAPSPTYGKMEAQDINNNDNTSTGGNSSNPGKVYYGGSSGRYTPAGSTSNQYRGSQPATSSAATPGGVLDGTYTVKGNKYSVSGSNVSLVSAKKKIKSITVSYVIINGVPLKVTAIGKNAFKNRKALKKVTLGGEVEKIGAGAFFGCKKLKIVNVRTGVLTSVGKNAFKGTNKKIVFKLNKSKFKAYKKLLKKGKPSAKAKYRKL